LNRSWMKRWPMAVVVLAALALSVSGCAGGARPRGWTGLTVVDESVYASDLEQLQVLDTADGRSLWTFPKDPREEQRGTFHITPAVDEEHVIVASYIPSAGLLSQPRHVVWALDRETGNTLWTFEGASGQYVEGGALSGGLFIIGNGDGNVYALDVERGNLKWTFETGHRVWATPLIVSETVYIGSMDRHLYALDLSSGEVQWSFQTKGAFASEPVLRNGTLYIGAFDNSLYAVDAQTGTEQWRFAGENWFWGSPAVYDDAVYAADVKGNIYALDADTGETLWHQSLDTAVRAGIVTAEDGSKLFVGGEDGTLYALDPSDGFTLWMAEAEGQVLSPPVVSGSVIYEALLYGSQRIRALHVDNGREIWAYPPTPEE